MTLLYEKNERLGFPSRRRPGRSRPDAPTALPLYQWTEGRSE